MSLDTMKLLVAEVTAAAVGIKATVDDMRTISVDKIAGPAAEYGNASVATAFSSFCNRWNEGVKNLIADTDGLADALDLAVATYAQRDQESARQLGIPIVADTHTASSPAGHGAGTASSGTAPQQGGAAPGRIGVGGTW